MQHFRVAGLREAFTNWNGP